MDYFKVITHALEMGQAKGAYSLKDARVIANSLEAWEKDIKAAEENMGAKMAPESKLGVKAPEEEEAK